MAETFNHAQVYLDALRDTIEEANGDTAFIAKAFGDVTRAKGMTKKVS